MQKLRHSFVVCDRLGWNWHNMMVTKTECAFFCVWGALPLAAWCWEPEQALCSSSELAVPCPQCAPEQITHFYFYTNVHNFIHFLWLLWQEKEIYDAHHPFIWHRQCLLLREAFSWNWLHNFLLVYCFQVISQDLFVLRYRDTSLRPAEYYSRGKKKPYGGKYNGKMWF